MANPVLQQANDGAHLDRLREMMTRDDLITWRGLFAFVNLGGLILLDGIPGQSLTGFLDRGGRIEWVVGTDAITTVGALHRLRRFADLHRNVIVRTYKSQPGETLFHPKLSIFEFEDGTGAVLAGSSNLTAGGLRRNVEFSIALELGEHELAPWLDAYDDIATLEPHTSDILDVDIEEIAPPRIARRRPVARPVAQDAEPLEGERVLIRGVPLAGGRFAQLSQHARYVREFFGLDEDAEGIQYIQLQEVSPEGDFGPVETRPLVFADSNKNRRFEVSGLSRIAYPDEGVPLVVFTATDDDGQFWYFIRLPGQPGYNELQEYLNFEHGGDVLTPDQLRRISDQRTRAELVAVWNGFPE